MKTFLLILLITFQAKQFQIAERCNLQTKHCELFYSVISVIEKDSLVYFSKPNTPVWELKIKRCITYRSFLIYDLGCDSIYKGSLIVNTDINRILFEFYDIKQQLYWVTEYGYKKSNLPDKR